MATTTFTDNVVINGSQDITQLKVKGYSTQNQPLEGWQDNAGNTLAQVTGDGKFEIGNNLGGGAPHDAIIQANQNITLPTAGATSGLHSLGALSGTISSAVNWVVHELQLSGSGGVSGLQTANKVKLTQGNTGTSTSAELRAVDGTSLNQGGSGGAYVGKATGVRGTASNATSAYLTNAAGVEGTVTNDSSGTITNASALSVAAPTNSGTITNLYGLNIPDITQGTNNYAISTNKGNVVFNAGNDANTKVGIGTTNPSALLDTAGIMRSTRSGLATQYVQLNGGDASSINITASSGTGAEKILVMENFSSEATPGANNKIYFRVGSSGTPVNAMAIETSGNVGIGTTSPGSKLEVNGTASVTGFKLTSSPTSGYVLTTDANGNGTWQQSVNAVAAPVAAIEMYAGSSAPSGWLFCNGSAVSRTTYSALFGVIGTTFGTGDGSTTFNLPDLRGRAPIGVGQGSGLTNRALAASGGEETHALTEAELASHRHTISQQTGGSGTYAFSWVSGGTPSSQYTGYTGSGTGHNTMQPWLALNFIIKT